MTQRNPHATAPVNIADDVPADLDLPEGEGMPTNAYFPARPKLPTAREALLRAVFESALDERRHGRLPEGDRLAIVVRVPSRSGVKAVDNYFSVTINCKKWSRSRATAPIAAATINTTFRFRRRR
jgi:hypothetical protein